MIGKVEFLNLPGSMSSCEYPLLTSANQSLTSYTLKTYNNVKFSLDLVQTIRVPYFTNYDKANCVRMNNEIYWITAVKNETMADTTLVFALQYNGASSLVHKSDNVSGFWLRSGLSDNNPWMRMTPYSGETYIAGSQQLPVIGSTNDSNRIFWVQITSTEKIKSNTSASPYVFVSSGDKPRAEVEKTQDQYTVYGMFVRGDSGPVYETATTISYPSLEIVITNIELYGFTASNITNIAISERCPFAMSYSSGAYYKLSSSLNYHPIYYGSRSSATNIIYDVTSILTPANFERKSITLSWSRDYWRLGAVSVRNGSGQIVGNIPLAYYDTTLYIRTFADYNGIYTKITTYDGQYNIIFPEGKLPWIGSTWEEYRAYSMAFDRQNAIIQTNKAETDNVAMFGSTVTGSIVSTAMLGAVAGPVGFALGATAGIVNTTLTAVASERSIGYANAEQQLLEKRMQAQPGTAYAPELGLSYIYECITYGSRICLELPLGYYWDDTWLDDYISYFGYPADGTEQVLSISEGYYKGKLLYTTAFARGLKFDECNSEFINGFRFKEV